MCIMTGHHQKEHICQIWLKSAKQLGRRFGFKIVYSRRTTGDQNTSLRAQLFKALNVLGSAVSKGTVVVPVCNGSSSNMADEVYIDMSGAPTQTTSSCYCTLTFQRSGENYVNLKLTTEDGENGTVTIKIDRINIRARSITYEMISIRRMKLTITPMDTAMRSCLHLKNTTTDTSSFKAECYPPGMYTGVTKTVTGYSECETRNKDSESGKFRDNTFIGPVAGGVIGGYFVVIFIAIFIVKRQRKNTSTREHNMTAI